MASSGQIPPGAFDSDSINSLPIAFTAVFLPFVLVFVVLRLYCRYNRKATWGFDDVLVVIATVGQIGLAAITFDLAINGGSGYHILYLEYNYPQKINRFTVDVFALQVIYYSFINVPKLAILVLYQRLFSVRPSILLATRVLMVVLVVYSIIAVLLTIFACGKSVDAFWNEAASGHAKCLDVDAMQIYTSIPNIVTDVLILLIPIPVVWQLHLRRSVKLGIALTFLIGSLGLVFSAIRFYVTYKIDRDADQTYVSARLLVWSTVEPGCYLICACLLILRPLVERMADFSIIQSLRSVSLRGSRGSDPSRDAASKLGGASYTKSDERMGSTKGDVSVNDNEARTSSKPNPSRKLFGGSKDVSPNTAEIELESGLHFPGGQT